MFAGSHHRLIFGSSGEEAVAKSRELKPDILLLDIRMPGMDGDEALAEIRKTPGLEFLPVIAVTASSLANEENARKERFSGYVRKPFSKRELFEELADFLPRHSKPESPGENRRLARTETAPRRARRRPRNSFPNCAGCWWSRGRPSATAWRSMKARNLRQGLEGLGQRWQCEPFCSTRKNCSATRKIMR